MAGHADLCVDIARCCHGAHACEPVERFACVGDGIPTVLAKGDHIGIHMGGGFPIGEINLCISVGVLDRGADAITPCALVLMAWRCEGCTRELFAVEAVVAFLWGIHALWKGVGQSLGFKVVPKTGHVAFVRAVKRRGLCETVRKCFLGHGAHPVEFGCVINS